jgi:hypothetical protein
VITYGLPEIFERLVVGYGSISVKEGCWKQSLKFPFVRGKEGFCRKTMWIPLW